jgi:hypothetical protein
MKTKMQGAMLCHFVLTKVFSIPWGVIIYKKNLKKE